MKQKNLYINDGLADFKYFLNEMNLLGSDLRKKDNNNVDIGMNKKFRKFIQIDDVLIAIDSWNPEADLIFISHAHMDHIPNIPPKILEKYEFDQHLPQFIISKITRVIAESRTHGKFKIPDSACLIDDNSIYPQKIIYKGVNITILENGHTYGSLSLFIEGSETILYTSDFITEDRILPYNRGTIKGLKPIECDRLVMECTFGAPKYQFPPFINIISVLNKYIDDSIMKGFPVILLAYSFGKGQILLNSLEDSHEILLERSIAENTRILEKNGIKFTNWEPYGKYNKNKLKNLDDYILIIPPYLMHVDPYNFLISNGAKVVSLSGKCLDESYRKEFPAEIYLSFSDHCDNNRLLEFIGECNSKYIYLEHGMIENISYLLQKKEDPSFIKKLNFIK